MLLLVQQEVQSSFFILPFPLPGVPQFPVTGIMIGVHEGTTVRVKHAISGPEIPTCLRSIGRIMDLAEVGSQVKVSARMVPRNRISEINPSLEPCKFLMVEIPGLDKAEPP